MERIRGSAEIGINKAGAADLAKNAQQVLRLGIPSKIYLASDKRVLQSALIIARQGPQSLAMTIQRPEEAWDTWNLGAYEGRPKAEVQHVIDELRLKTPWVVPLGMGKLSSKPGESFNQAKSRIINRLWKLINEIKQHPNQLLYVVTHDSVLTLIRAYLDKYNGRPTPQDMGYSLKAYVSDDEGPGTAYSFHFEQDDGWELEPIKETNKLTGVVFWRHAETDWN